MQLKSKVEGQYRSSTHLRLSSQEKDTTDTTTLYPLHDIVMLEPDSRKFTIKVMPY